MRNAGIEHLVDAALGHAFRLGRVGARQQRGKLFAAITRHQFARAFDAQAQNTRHLAQAFVAGLVTIVVVVALEMVDVDDQQRQLGLGARAALPLGLQGLVEQAPVRDAGQPVGGRQAQQLFVGALQRQAFFHHRRHVQPRHDQVTGRCAGFVKMHPMPVVGVAQQRRIERAAPGQAQCKPLFLAPHGVGDLARRQRAAHQVLVGLADHLAFAAVRVLPRHLLVVADQPVLVVVDRQAGGNGVQHLAQAQLGGPGLRARQVQFLQRQQRIGSLVADQVEPPGATHQRQNQHQDQRTQQDRGPQQEQPVRRCPHGLLLLS